jgi:hypothetical protein
MPMPRKALATVALLAATTLHGAPTVYPTGTTLYQPDKTWNGYTVLSILNMPAIIVIDMNGNVVKRWEGFNVSAGGPARVFPNGLVMAPTGANPPRQEALALVQQDFDGTELWRYDHNEEITTREGTSVWSARQHHDWQRTDFPAGYYSPGVTPGVDPANTLVLTHTNYTNPAVADVMLEDDRLIELSPAGEVLWDWRAGDHIDQFRFDTDELAAIKAAPGVNAARGSYDWLHINSADYVGPNQWYDAGDARFAPDNVIISSRQASFVAIVARDGSVVWQIGPDFLKSEQERAIGQVIGQHHAHVIPKGLPGAGNVLIFDNGGASGYGAPTSIAQNGSGIYARSTSRVVEINPVTLERVWMYTAPNFFSTNISGAQRLENGNTLITEGAPGRIFEVTPDNEIVWEYMNAPTPTGNRSNSVYRAYRIPYGWLPQLVAPTERTVTPPLAGTFVLPAD